jgi:two-component system sensor histidine kinase TctE
LADRRFSLHGQLLWRLLPALLLLFSISGTGAYLLVLHYANGVYDSWLIDSAHSLALVVRQGPQGLVLDLPESSRQLFVWDSADTTYYKVSNARGELIAGTTSIPFPPEDARRSGDTRLFDARVGNIRVRVATLDLHVGDQSELVQVAVAETSHKRDRLAHKILLAVLLPQVLLIAIAAAVIGRGVGRALAPLQDIAERIDRHEHDRSLQPLPFAGVPQEVLPLTQALNSMLARLSHALAAQRKFITDAAHQLRTPLAGLKLNIGQAQTETDPVARRQLLDDLGISTDRAIRLANQMLSLARAEPGALNTDSFGEVDLNVVVREVGAEWVPIALTKNIELGFDAAAAPVIVRGSAALIGEALNNLIDNAIKYHPGDGSISLSVRAHPVPELAVDDDGIGIPPEDRQRVRQRFLRLDRAQPPGAGLGLAIVDEIVEAHGARFELLTGSSGHGTLAVIRFAATTPAGRRVAG